MKFDSYYDDNLLQPEVGAHPRGVPSVDSGYTAPLLQSLSPAWLRQWPLKGEIELLCDISADILQKIIIIIGIKLHTW